MALQARRVQCDVWRRGDHQGAVLRSGRRGAGGAGGGAGRLRVPPTAQTCSCGLLQPSQLPGQVTEPKRFPVEREKEGIHGCAWSRWKVAGTSPCSASCDLGVAQRTVFCVQFVHGAESSVPEEKCRSAVKPATTAPCLVQVCTYRWEVKAWSQVLRAIGWFLFPVQGRRTRGSVQNRI